MAIFKTLGILGVPGRQETEVCEGERVDRENRCVVRVSFRPRRESGLESHQKPARVFGTLFHTQRPDVGEIFRRPGKRPMQLALSGRRRPVSAAGSFTWTAMTFQWGEVDGEAMKLSRSPGGMHPVRQRRVVSHLAT